MRVFVTGATGLIGKEIARALQARGDEVVALSRSRARAAEALASTITVVEGDVTTTGPWQDEAATCDAVIHLAGDPVVGRWSDEKKRAIYDSRVNSTRAVVAALAKRTRPGVLVSTSAVGFYGDGGEGDAVTPVDEEAPAGHDFLAEVCTAWEAEAAKLPAPHRVSVVRVGVVLARGGGALAAMLPAFKAFVGGPVGSGKQWVSWVHIDDVVGIFLKALDEPRAVGPINAVSPGPCTMKTLATEIGRALGRPSWLPAPSFALRALFGEGAEPVLTGQRVLPKRAEALGYAFRFPFLAAALKQILR